MWALEAPPASHGVSVPCWRTIRQIGSGVTELHLLSAMKRGMLGPQLAVLASNNACFRAHWSQRSDLISSGSHHAPNLSGHFAQLLSSPDNGTHPFTAEKWNGDIIGAQSSCPWMRPSGVLGRTQEAQVPSAHLQQMIEKAFKGKEEEAGRRQLNSCFK